MHIISKIFPEFGFHLRLFILLFFIFPEPACPSYPHVFIHKVKLKNYQGMKTVWGLLLLLYIKKQANAENCTQD